jgi:hypothetical protein
MQEPLGFKRTSWTWSLSAENALPLGISVCRKNSCCCGDDDSGTYGGQLFMYVSNTVGDLANGSLYMMKRTNDNQREKTIVVGESYPVSFIKIENHTTMTGNQINTSSKYIESN